MKIYHFKLFVNFLTYIFFFTSCSIPARTEYFPKAQQKRFEAFFKHFLFLEDAVYTLYGSKPITEIVLTPETPAERLAMQEEALKNLSKAELAQLKASSFEYDEEYWFEESWTM